MKNPQKNAGAVLKVTAKDPRCFSEENFCVCKDLFECFKGGLFCDVILIADDGQR